MAVLAYSENVETELELVTAGLMLESSVAVALIGSPDHSENISKLSVSGVSSIFFASNEQLEEGRAEIVTDALEAICRVSKPDLVLVGSSKRGKEVAPRLATRLSMGCISEGKNIQVSNGFSADRLVWGGNAIAQVGSKGATVITIPPRSYERGGGTSKPEVKKVEFRPASRTSAVVERKEKSKGQVNIKDAQAIVSAGRGFKKKEDLSLLDGLASALNAVVGASRPLTSDLGWMPEDRQVGLSGVTVKPKLYVAVGISGQIQHLTGMRDSKLVVAINSDKNAPIFQECDYGIVGDLYAVVPALEVAIERMKSV